MKPPEILKQIPKVEKVLTWSEDCPELQTLTHTKLVAVIRMVLADLRDDILRQFRDTVPPDMEILNKVRHKALDLNKNRLQSVINATGIILHTNLGRAPLAPQALEQIKQISRGYSTLEYDPQTGKRDHRQKPAEDLLIDLTGAQAAAVVNNNAAALFLLTVTLARNKKVLVSRGELVEIGGSFRLSDIIEACGAQILAVGSTNHTRLADYRRALETDDDISLILKVHTSNFRQIGYCGQTSVQDLAPLAREYDLPLAVDAGSGTLIDLTDLGLTEEIPVQKLLAQGAEAVCFSGDKLLGATQAGIIVGSKSIIDPLKSHPLARTVRPDKLTLAALETTLRLVKDPNEGKKLIPAWRMLSLTNQELHHLAVKLKKALGPFPGLKLSLCQLDGQTGGGAAPEEALPSWGIAIESLVNPINLLEEKLRTQTPPVVARIQRNRLLLDVRTIFPHQFAQIRQNLSLAWGQLVGGPAPLPEGEDAL
jgi:L-seryl-tRNA(Ser) seleniumtransferase